MTRNFLKAIPKLRGIDNTVNHYALPASCPGGLTTKLLKLHPSIERWIPELWLHAPHQVVGGKSFAISLSKLDMALTGIDLVAAAPSVLSRAVRKRQLTFVGGRLCAERAVFELGLPVVSIARAEGGEPLWPTGLHGSITHTDRAAYAVVVPTSTSHGLGIDSEQVVGASGLRSILTMCCTTFEKTTWLNATPDPLVATLIFSAKEAGYKAMYGLVRRVVDFGELEISALDMSHGQLVLRPVPGKELAGRVRPFRVNFFIERGEINCIHTIVAEHCLNVTV